MNAPAYIRLTEAAKRLGLSVASLRTEAKRGHLAVSRVANKDWTTEEAVTEMFERCRVQLKEQDSGYDRPDQDTPRHGSSKTEHTSAALVSAHLRLERLSKSSPNTSGKSASPARRVAVETRTKLRSPT